MFYSNEKEKEFLKNKLREFFTSKHTSIVFEDESSKSDFEDGTIIIPKYTDLQKLLSTLEKDNAYIVREALRERLLYKENRESFKKNFPQMAPFYSKEFIKLINLQMDIYNAFSSKGISVFFPVLRHKSYAYNFDVIGIGKDVDLEKLLSFLNKNDAFIIKHIFSNLLFYKTNEAAAEEYFKNNFSEIIPLSFKEIMTVIQCDSIESLAHWWRNGEFLRVHTYHKNQRRICYVSDMFRFQYVDAKLEYYQITENSFENMLQKVFEEQLKPLLAIIDKNITFERLFFNDDKVNINLLSQFYLVHIILSKIKDTSFSNLLEKKEIEIHLNFKSKTPKPVHRDYNVLLNGNTNENIFAMLYKYFIDLISCYNALSCEDKIKELFIKRFDIKVDFTKRKHSFAYSDRHIIISKHIALKKLLDFLESSNNYIVKDIFNNMIYYKINEEYVNKYFKDNFAEVMPLSLQELFSLLNCASNKYLIDKLKTTNTLTIKEISYDNKKYLQLEPKSFNCIVKHYNKDNMLVYNYTNSHIDNKVKKYF